MNLSRRLTISLISLLCMVLIACAAGGYGTLSLSRLLTFITTQAWDTADGAMEGSIGIEAQMIAVERITAGRSNDETQALMQEGDAMADEALGRMVAAGLMSTAEINQTRQHQQAFNQAKTTIIERYTQFAQHRQQLDQLIAQMHQVMTRAEALGDTQVEQLENSPERYISWNSGLNARWSAADGAMEAQIHFLEISYFLQQYMTEQNNAPIHPRLTQAQSAFTQTITAIAQLPLFQQTPLNDTSDRSLADELGQRMNAINLAVTTMVELTDAYHQALEQYNQSSNALLATIEAVETSADSKVESQTEVISATQAIAYGLLACALLLGIGMAYLSMRKVRLDIIEPIESLTQNMQAAAQGKRIDNRHTDRADEIGSMANALKVFVELFEDNKRISAESHRTAKALAVCNTAVLIANTEQRILFSNEAMNSLIDRLSPELHNLGITLDSTNLLQQSIDLFAQGQAFIDQINRLKHAQKTELALGPLRLIIGLAPIENNGQRIGTVLEIEDKTEEYHQRDHERHIAQENTRIRQALDSVSANVMVADTDRTVIYLNGSLANLLTDSEQDFRQDLPHFNAKQVLGQSLDQFHQQPQQQAELLQQLTDTHSSAFTIGGRSIHLTLNPILDDNRQRLGTVVEWLDRTVETGIEQELDSIVDAASSGDLSKRIVLTGKEGFFYTLSKGLNSLLDSVSLFITDVSNMFAAMKDGDLTHNIDSTYQGEFEQITRNANDSFTNLAQVISQIRALSTIVESSSQSIAQGNADLSKRTEEQASSLQQTATSMEAILQRVKQSAQHASKANELASSAHTQARSGEQVVQDAIVAMEEILKSSKQINDIIGVIDEIAFQTNLLALNAAVEAARAGEQGRGFAVVASEVRSLSQRSANAAKEIKELILESVSKVESGSVLVNESGKTLNSIMAAVEQVARMIEDVSRASGDQTQGIEEINAAVTRMDHITQQNAALVEEASASSSDMSTQARRLDQVMSFFQLPR